ncbi:MAG: right-handed parallel beta-helix repeat-containing protein [Anaerolineales bacterium]|nr:right-handed parallel beta-helix repeat-containing protein [Anaerolineales bacterium]
MKTRLASYVLVMIMLTSCNPSDAVEVEQGDGSPASFLAPEDGAPPAPMLIGEEIFCTFFVAPDGDDGGPGSEAQPWGSFQRAAEAVEPGGTVCFREGIYVLEDPAHITHSGTADAPLVFIAYPGERPILDGGGEAGGLIVLDPGASYVRISGFTLQRFTVWGLEVTGGNRYVYLDHLSVEGGEAGIHFTYGEDDLAPPEGGAVEYITLEDSLVFNSEYTAVDCTPGPCDHMSFRRVEIYGSGLHGEASFGSDGLAISRGYPLLVEDCSIHDNGGDGIDLNSRDREGYAADVVVRRNRVVRNRLNGIKLWAGGLIENNLVWGQGDSALWLGTFNSELVVVNNTIAFNMWDPAYSGRNWAFSAGYPEEIVALPQVDLMLVNNIFAFNSGPDLGAPTGLFLGPGVRIQEHHNLYFSAEEGEITAEFLDAEFTRADIGSGVWTDRSGQGQGDLVDNPLFLSGWPQVDLRLQPESPAIDAGDPATCPSLDFLGVPRPADGDGDGAAVCDIGAFEWRE